MLWYENPKLNVDFERYPIHVDEDEEGEGEDSITLFDQAALCVMFQKQESFQNFQETRELRQLAKQWAVEKVSPTSMVTQRWQDSAPVYSHWYSLLRKIDASYSLPELKEEEPLLSQHRYTGKTKKHLCLP